MPFTLNDACFFPFSRLFSTPTASPTTPPLLAHLLAKSYLSSLPLAFFLLFHLIFKREIWINLLCVAEGMTSCELQILANTAIYLKWQIRQSNLQDTRRFFELSSFEKSLCFLIAQGSSAEKRKLIQMSMPHSNEKVQFWDTRWALIGVLFLWMRCQGMLWIFLGIGETAHCPWSTELY